MVCPVIKYLDIFRNGTPTEKNILATEIFIRKGCPRVRELTVALNTFIILKDQARKDRDDPCIQEQDKKNQLNHPSGL